MCGFRKNALVTGATGLLGQQVCFQLVERGWSVTGLVREIPDRKVAGVRYFKHDFVDPKACLSDLPGEQYSSIFHLAQSRYFRDFPDMADDVFAVNIKSTAQLLNFGYANSIKQFVYASSGGIYKSLKRDLTEDDHLLPISELGYYLGSKICGETLVNGYKDVMSIKILRPFFIYGPGQNNEMLVMRLINNIFTGKPITLNGHEGISINPIHVNDAAEAFICSLVIKGSSVINVAGPEKLSLRDISETIGSLIGKQPKFEVHGQQGHDLTADNTKTVDMLKRKLITFRDGIRSVLEAEKISENI